MLLTNLFCWSYETAAGCRIKAETSTCAKFVIVWIDRWHWWFQFISIEFEARILLQFAGRRHIMLCQFCIHRMGCRLHFCFCCCCCCCSLISIAVVLLFMRCINVKQITMMNVSFIDDLYIAWNEAFYKLGFLDHSAFWLMPGKCNTRSADFSTMNSTLVLNEMVFKWPLLNIADQ